MPVAVAPKLLAAPIAQALQKLVHFRLQRLGQQTLRPLTSELLQTLPYQLPHPLVAGHSLPALTCFFAAFPVFLLHAYPPDIGDLSPISATGGYAIPSAISTRSDITSVLPLPTYAPKLNVIELLWKYLRLKVTHNHLYESIDKVVEAVKEFFNRLDANLSQVLSVIGNTG
jgi:transposase